MQACPAVSAARASFALALTPHGRVTVDPAPPDSELVDEAWAQALTAHLARDEAAALLDLGARHPDAALPPSVAYFRDLARAFVAASAASPNAPAAVPEAPSDLAARVERAYAPHQEHPSAPRASAHDARR